MGKNHYIEVKVLGFKAYWGHHDSITKDFLEPDSDAGSLLLLFSPESFRWRLYLMTVIPLVPGENVPRCCTMPTIMDNAKSSISLHLSICPSLPMA